MGRIKLSYDAQRNKDLTLFDFTNTGIPERQESFKQIITSGDKHTQENAYLNLLQQQENFLGLTDAEACKLLGMPKSERAGARRIGLMNKHEDYFKEKYGTTWKEHFYPLIVKNGRRTNIYTKKGNSVWMMNHNKKMYEGKK